MALEYIEDYIEFLFGSLDKDGKPNSGLSFNPVIKLATYDKSPVSSMGGYCARARTNKLEECLTDRQIGLARKIVAKYRRQLGEHGVILPEDVDAMPARHGLRSIDRSKALTADLDNRKFYLRFPYDPQKISSLHTYSSNSAGRCVWDQTNKRWEFDLTEGNLRTAIDLFKSDDIKIDDGLSAFVEDILRSTPAQLPHVSFEDGRLVLHNCHVGVHEYLESRDFDPADSSRTSEHVAYMASLGIDMHESVKQHLTDRFGYEVACIICDRKSVMPSNNQPDGPWHENLLEANHALSAFPWVLYLNWWSDKTDWSDFKNIVSIKPGKKSYNSIDPVFAEKLINEEPIVIMDSVVGLDPIRHFIEQRAHKVIYISDIGSGT